MSFKRTMILQVLLLAVFLHGCSAQLLPDINCDLNVSSSVSTGSVGYHVEGDFESGRDGGYYYTPGKTYKCKHTMLSGVYITTPLTTRILSYVSQSSTVSGQLKWSWYGAVILGDC